MNRREFLGAMVCLGLAAGLKPALGKTRRPPKLVAIHLFGGNDGLNTLVPWTDPAYRKARPTLALNRSQLLPLGPGLALHNALQPLWPLWERGRLAILQGVGTPQPNRSHFESSHLWQSPDGRLGWLGQLAQSKGWQTAQVDPESLSAALWTPTQSPLCVAPNSSPWSEADPWLLSSLDELYRQSPSLHLGKTYSQVRRLQKAQGGCPGEQWQGPPLARSLKTVLQLWSMAQVYHISVSGFDTHGGQAQAQAQALHDLAQSLADFYQELQRRKWEEEVLVLVYSEFGRRVQENASGGTDHGGAGPVFLLGTGVKGGIYGDSPSLQRLHDGDLIPLLDFRQVYATVLERALECDSRSVLGGSFETLPCLG